MKQALTFGVWFLQAMINLLYFCGMTHFVRESLIKRYFGSEVRDAAASVGGADMLKTLCQVSNLPSLFGQVFA